MTRPMHQDAAAAAVLRRTMVLLLLLLMFSFSSFPSVTAECPDKCKCKEEHVDCYRQELDWIPDHIPPATKGLWLSYNYISKLKNGAFSNLSKLQTLDLSGNEIIDIESLDHLTELQYLDLSFNEIRDIEPKSFTHLAELDTLQLSYNNISELKNGAFSNLLKLQKLFLNENKIEIIESGVFNNLKSLKELHLQYNKIHKIDLEMFKGIAKLDKLYLQYNMISNIPPGIFDSLTSLSVLELTQNNISELKNGAFSNLSKLPKLYLNDNKIRDIEPKSFTHLTELRTLWLDNNDISELKNGTFANLSKLRLLYLEGNKIENIETGVFNNLTSLKELHLEHNKIHKLDLEMFMGPAKLDWQYLDHNMISDIPPGMFDSLTSLSLLQLDHNPLTCDCNILLFLNVLKKNYPHRHVLGKYNDDPSCHFPVEMREKSLNEITENDFNCTSPDVIVVPEKKTVSVGEQLQLSCRAVGNPEPSITWAKDDIDLKLGQRVQVLQNNTLIISKVERTDGGQYKCVASNSFGRKSFEAMVNVNVPLTTDGKLHLNTDHVERIIPETEYCVEYYAKNGTAEAAKLRAQVCSNAKQPPISFAYWVIYTASIVCLVLTLIVYATLPYLRNAHGYYVMFYMACQLVYFVCVMIRSTVKHTLDSPLCIPFGYFTLFAILTTCCWLNVICFDIYWTLRYNNSTNRNTSKSVRTIMYHIYCWGFSSICVSTGYFFQHSQNETLRKLAPDIGKYTCFLGEYYRYGTFIFYYLPSCGTLAVNLIWFSLTANHYLRIKSQLNTFRQNDSITERFLVYKERFVMSIKLFLVFGIPFLFWMLCKPFDIHGIIIKIIEKIYYLQGVYIFIIFVAKPKVIKEIRKKFRRSTVQSELTPLNNIPGSS